ncbi:unnamed protein product [Coregonus sp. 'balchen']|nr:unnamed protein product [Coregonus sp. 'balchen']
MAYGHNFASCGAKKCRVCGSEEHIRRGTVTSRRSATAHLWRECTARHKSYAASAGGGAGAGAGDGGGRGGEVPDPSAWPEAIPSTTEEEPRTAAGGEGDGQGTAVAVLDGEVVPEMETEGSVGEEVPEKEVGEEPATALGGEENGGGGVGGKRDVECPGG